MIDKSRFITKRLICVFLPWRRAVLLINDHIILKKIIAYVFISGVLTILIVYNFDEYSCSENQFRHFRKTVINCLDCQIHIYHTWYWFGHCDLPIFYGSCPTNCVIARRSLHILVFGYAQLASYMLKNWFEGSP